ncbi:MAG: hypothetical protein MZV63_47950 [Marinilabiliales bacterium]|nr:hypothetical protein [Marinilabiliales bacterium]
MIAVVTEGDQVISKMADYVMEVPDTIIGLCSRTGCDSPAAALLSYCRSARMRR